MRRSILGIIVCVSLLGCGDTSGDATGDGNTTATSEADDDTTAGDGDGDGDTTGDGDGDTTGDGDGDVSFTLTSTDFEMDGIIPSVHHFQGGNVSPALSWVGAPAGTMSFGVYFHDLDFQPQGYPYRHSAIWNIPADVEGLPQGVEMSASPSDVPGATQCLNWFGEYGYGGPGSASNTYEFILYALDVAELSEVDAASDLAEVKTALDAHALDAATLSGQTEGPP
jgi:Raf kinase inhibitor-like YbhB/YbcL family protein